MTYKPIRLPLSFQLNLANRMLCVDPRYSPLILLPALIYSSHTYVHAFTNPKVYEVAVPAPHRDPLAPTLGLKGFFAPPGPIISAAIFSANA